jgi:hypothetical protein
MQIKQMTMPVSNQLQVVLKAVHFTLAKAKFDQKEQNALEL